MRRIALGLLLLMGVLLMTGRAMRAHIAFWSYVAAFAESATIGGMADWFAVTALLRHPLGLRIPHTAIIPSNKARIGDSIARSSAGRSDSSCTRCHANWVSEASRQ